MECKEEIEVLYEELDVESVEIINLLSSFGLSDRFVTEFVENGYTVELLKNIERREIEDIIGPPHLADRTKLIVALNEWRQEQGLPPVSTPSDPSKSPIKLNRSTNLQRQDYTARFLITSSPRGRAIIEIYGSTNILTKAQKKAITHIVVDEFKDVFGKLTSSELKNRAAELKQLFPTESEYTWYQPAVEFQGAKKIRLGKLAKGCLYDRNLNYKAEHHKHQQLQISNSEQSQERDLLSEAAIAEYEQIKNWIRHNEDEWESVKVIIE
ncbi:uncharacterized protein LOC134219727 [Armigeres subalbatus]|uniref:uncharacterized protein LOC134219727 n=1 Tax=Armigeres subalbatus TaxID=124917 RepID=UPI002ED2E0EA